MAGDSLIPKMSLRAKLSPRKVAGWTAALLTMLAITWLFWPKPPANPYQLAPVELGDVGATHDVLKVPVAALAFTPYDPRGKLSGISTSTTTTRRSQGTSGSSHNASLLQSLDLTTDQRRQIEPVLDAARDDAERHYGTATGDQRRKILRDTMRIAFDQIRPLLTKDQQAKLELAYVQIGSAGVGAGRGVVYLLSRGKPVAIPVRVGASDGAFTVVQSYDLKEGDKVVTGGGPHPHS